jgi:hypothetical protein
MRPDIVLALLVSASLSLAMIALTIAAERKR